MSRHVLPLLLVAVLATSYYAACSLLLFASFHANGWDLGISEQVLWNTARGRWFEHSFRESLYLGDHWQPVFVLLVPLSWLGLGATALLVTQAAVLGAAVVPLYDAARRLTGVAAAGAAVAAYALGLGVAGAVSFDFHVEAFAPLLAFGALWALATNRPRVFVGAALSILLLKEDAALLTLGLCWVAWSAFGWRRLPTAVAALSAGYAAIVNAWLLPLFRGDESSALLARYGYLGESASAVVWHLVTQPQLALEQLLRGHALAAVLLVMLGAGMLPLLVPRLLPALLLVAFPPLLSAEPLQSGLRLHYMLVPGTVALLLAVLGLRAVRVANGRTARARVALLVAWAIGALALFAVKSPLPPSLRAEWGRFDVDTHARVARSFVRDVPDDLAVSAQSPFVPWLAQREDIYQFPRLLDAQYVLLDRFGPIPADDLKAGYEACKGALPRLGFDVVREHDGLTLWRKTRAAMPVPEVPDWCSGQRG